MIIFAFESNDNCFMTMEGMEDDFKQLFISSTMHLLIRSEFLSMSPALRLALLQSNIT